MKKVFLYQQIKGTRKVEVSENFAMVDDSDYETAMAHKWFLMKLYHCKSDIRYARRYENNKAILLHRFIMSANVREIEVDHKDHNGLNCQRDNLRFGNHAENMSHRRPYGASKYLGVHKTKKGWACSTKHLGASRQINFSTEKEAALAYNYLSHFNKGVFANINDIYADGRI